MVSIVKPVIHYPATYSDDVAACDSDIPAYPGSVLPTCPTCLEATSTYTVEGDAYGDVWLWRSHYSDMFGPNPLIRKADTDRAVWAATCRVLVGGE